MKPSSEWRAAVPSAQSPADNQKAILATIGGMGGFALGDVCMKLASASLPLGQTVALRGMFASLLTLALAARLDMLRPGLGRQLLTLPMGLRTAAEIGSTLFFFSALFALPFADANALLQALPLALTAASALVLGERVGWRRWTATAAGLAGVLLIIKPGTSGFAWASLYAIAAVLCITVRDLSTRRIPRGVPGLTLTAITSVTVMLSGFALGLVESWVWPSGRVWLLLVAAGATVVVGHFLVVTAMRTGEVAASAPFRYTVVLYALLLGWLVWGEVPDGAMLAGTALVTAAGLYVFHRERVRIGRSD
jgi:drug/metabolite transporter (DMT)-like permease